MKILRNDDAIGAVIAADVRGDSRTAIKPLFVARNTYLVGLDAPIFRIVQIDHLFDDIRNGELTHTRIGEKSWGDPLENPLFEREFPDPITGGKVCLRGLVEDMFGSCWSLTPLDKNEHWSIFSHGKPSVRIESTPRKLLLAVMSDANPHYDVQHAIGKVQYLPTDEIEGYFGAPDYEKHFDTLGHGIYLSLMALQIDLQDEDEVRLVCNFMKYEAWVQQNLRLVGELLKVPCSWNDIVSSVVVGPLVGRGGQKDIEQKLQDLGILCPVTSSPARVFSD